MFRFKLGYLKELEKKENERKKRGRLVLPVVKEVPEETSKDKERKRIKPVEEDEDSDCIELGE